MALGTVLLSITAGCQKKTDAGRDNETEQKSNVSDGDRLLGVWSFESVDSGDEKRKMSKDPEARVQFQGERVIITESKNDPGERFTLLLDETKNPKWMTLMPRIQAEKSTPTTRLKVEPPNEEWIYKFEDDSLIVAVGAPIDPWKTSRPTDFKAQMWVVAKAGQSSLPSVILWRLKRTSDPFFQPAPTAPKKQSLLEEKLSNEELTWNPVNLNDIPLAELLAKLSKDHGVAFVILDEAFKKDGRPEIRTERPKLPRLDVQGMKLGSFLNILLASMKATYIVRADHIEITTLNDALHLGPSSIK